MEAAGENRGKSSFSIGMDEFSRDLLQKLKNRIHLPNDKKGKRDEEETDDEIELSLGLSLNGRFGVDPSRKKLRRSSSVSHLGFAGGDDGGSGDAPLAGPESHGTLVRACSLPTETEEWRRLKELRCMEARKKRMNKLKNVKIVKDKENSVDVSALHLHDDVNVQSVDGGIVSGFQNWNLMVSPQASIGSRSSDLQGPLMEGPKQNPAKSPSSSGRAPTMDQPAAEATNVKAHKDDEMLRSALLDMPYVSTKVFGPNHPKIEGFLYRYNKGDDVKIVCVCHGLFLSPAEFVKHGGGGDVAYPLKHIVVNPYPLY